MLLRRFAPCAVIAALFAALAPVTAADNSLYVDANSRGGSCADNRAPDQVTALTPWCSLSRALDATPAGRTVVVRGAKYPALTVDSRQRSALLTISAAPGERVEVAGVTFHAGSS